MIEGPSTPEEQYFQAHEARLRKKMREELERKAAERHAKRTIAADLGTEDRTVVDRIHALGLDRDVVRAVHLLPLVEVAWADGSVTRRERDTIMRAVEAHGIEPGSPAATFMASLLEERPSETLLGEVMRALREILGVHDLHPRGLLEACEDVARASGGLLGLGLGDTISDAEREAIRKVAESLGPDAVRKVTGELD